ncbi:hypothetical protein LAZ67_1002584 [Cordylochernes scorpioides]|uniref:Mitochondria-eating protein n=1 Tax=Cordylochernes scorpioides TaxID=51811 RepID=A0ABY6JYY3_9ARAC|nr:hypothetical protein LAZ67_1002584 [Cordylochernes scorpioides]
MKVTRKCVCTRVIRCANTVGSRLGETNGPPRALIRQYGNLYAQARVDTLDALDALPELRHLDDLKAKLLFSVIVLAFRSVQATLMEVYRGVRRALQLPETEPLPRELETAVGNYLGGTAGRFDLRRNVEHACSFKKIQIVKNFWSLWKMAISEPKSAHLREVLLFAFNWKKGATEAHRMLEEVYSDHALSKSQCYRWFKKFQSGDFELDNEPHGKPPQKFEDAVLQALLDEDSTQCRRNSQNSSRCLKVLFLYV